MPFGSILKQKLKIPDAWPSAVGWAAAWAWTIFAGGGGAMLLLEKGPLPLTNGWFALLSGIAVCPLTALLLKRYAGIAVSGRMRVAAAAFFFIAGRVALNAEHFI